jgi:hypothetical protein
VITTVAGQQLRDAFPWDAAPRYLLRDRDRIFGDDFTKQVQGMGIKEMLSAPQAPWVSNIKLSGFPGARRPSLTSSRQYNSIGEASLPIVRRPVIGACQHNPSKGSVPNYLRTDCFEQYIFYSPVMNSYEPKRNFIKPADFARRQALAR